MHMHQVRYFLALCEQGSFVRAARHCGVAQPSLTRAIQLLEQELGAALFERHRTGTRLTELGSLVRPHFLQIEQSAADARRKATKFLAMRSIATTRYHAAKALTRKRHVAAILAVIMIGLGATTSVLQMQPDAGRRDLPAQKIHDLTFVHSDSVVRQTVGTSVNPTS